MELDKIAGLPAHPLFVHIPVVLVPLAGIIAIVFAVRPAWLDRYGWGLVGLSGLGMIGAILAASSGEGLEEMIRENGEQISSSLREHAELGETARTISIIFFIVVLAIMLIRHFARRNAGSSNGLLTFAASKGGAIVMAVALVASAAAATYTMANAGHDGAKQVWEEEYGGSKNGGEEHDDDDESAPAVVPPVVVTASDGATA